MAMSRLRRVLITGNLGDDGQDEPVIELRKALDARPDPKPEFWVLGFGEGRDVP